MGEMYEKCGMKLLILGKLAADMRSASEDREPLKFSGRWRQIFSIACEIWGELHFHADMFIIQ